MPPKGDKKKKGQNTFTLSEFLSEGGSSCWADEPTDDYVVGDPPGQPTSLVGDWRAQHGGDAPSGREGGKFGRDDRRNDPKPLPTSPPWTLHIGNLSYDSTDDELTQFFANHQAKVKEVRIMMDKETNRPKGFGYVEFETLQDLLSAKQLDGSSVGGRRIRLDVSSSDRGKDRGGFGSGFGSGGGLADFGGRDEMGSAQQPGAGGMGGGPRMGGAPMGFDRNAMGSAQPQQQQQSRAAWGRDDMGNNTVPPPGPTRASFDRNAMGTQQQQTSEPRERTAFSREDLGSASQQPPQRKTVAAPAPWDRTALASAAQPELAPIDSQESERKVFDRSGFGASTEAWRSSSESNSKKWVGSRRNEENGPTGHNNDEGKKHDGFDRAGFGSSAAQEGWRGGNSSNTAKRGGNANNTSGDTSAPWRDESEGKPQQNGVEGTKKSKPSGTKDVNGFTEVKKEEKEEKKERKPKASKPQQSGQKKKDTQPTADNPWDVLLKKSKKKK